MKAQLLPVGVLVAGALLNAHAQTGGRFAAALVGRWCGGTENVVFSPYSLSAALAMTAAGGRGATAGEVADALGLPHAPEALAKAFAELDKTLAEGRDGSPGLALSVANALFPQRDYALNPAFVELIRTRFKGEAAPLDYAADPESARLAVNRWVEDRTAARIKDLLAPGVLTRATRLTLVNAVYFKGRWAVPFDPALTKPAPFRAPGNAAAQAPLMQRRGQMRYAEMDGLQAVELPYAGRRFVMQVLLPAPDRTVAEAVRQLADKGLEAWEGALAEADVTLFLPRFTCTWSRECTPTLQALGMTSIFDTAAADLSGIAGRPGELVVSAVVHKAFVEVAEEGTEAAAATGVAMKMTALRPPERHVVFRADRPFVYLVREKASGCVLFAGVVVKPGLRADG